MLSRKWLQGEFKVDLTSKVLHLTQFTGMQHTSLMLHKQTSTLQQLESARMNNCAGRGTLLRHPKHRDGSNNQANFVKAASEDGE